jgi:DNA-binding transcriptional ArsR family regulator
MADDEQETRATAAGESDAEVTAGSETDEAPDSETEDGAETDTDEAGHPATDELGVLADLLANPCAREILVRTAREPLSADELVARADASRTTVYRQLRRLTDADLLSASTELDPDGHHFDRYRARLDRLTVELSAEGFRVEIDRRPPTDDAVDRLERLFERLR